MLLAMRGVREEESSVEAVECEQMLEFLLDQINRRASLATIAHNGQRRDVFDPSISMPVYNTEKEQVAIILSDDPHRPWYLVTDGQVRRDGHWHFVSSDGSATMTLCFGDC